MKCRLVPSLPLEVSTEGMHKFMSLLQKTVQDDSNAAAADKPDILAPTAAIGPHNLAAVGATSPCLKCRHQRQRVGSSSCSSNLQPSLSTHPLVKDRQATGVKDRRGTQTLAQPLKRSTRTRRVRHPWSLQRQMCNEDVR
jgi:hypothetical protein